MEPAGECPKSPENVIPEVPSCDKDNSSAVQTGETRQSLEDGVGGNRALSDDGDGHVVTDKTVQRQEEAFRLPSVPDSSIQFQADWKSLRRNRTVLSDYFKVESLHKAMILFFPAMWKNNMVLVLGIIAVYSHCLALIPSFCCFSPLLILLPYFLISFDSFLMFSYC